jgi:hypothetical protein
MGKIFWTAKIPQKKFLKIAGHVTIKKKISNNKNTKNGNYNGSHDREKRPFNFKKSEKNFKYS